MSRFVLVRVLASTAAALSLGAGARAADAAGDLKKVLDEAWQFQLREDPLFATQVGDARYNDRLPSVAPSDYERRATFDRQTLDRLKGIDRAALSEADRVNYDMFQRTASDDLADLGFRTYRMPLNAEGSFHSDFARLPVTAPFFTTKDYDNYIARLHAFPAYARQHTENMREGLRTGFVQPKAILKGFEDTITTHIVELEATGAFGRFSFMEDVAVSEENRKTGKLVAMAMVKSVRQLASTLVVAA